MSQTDAGFPSHCGWCSHPPDHMVYHYGPCPRMKVIEYHPNGRVKRVEFVREPDPEPLVIDIDVIWPKNQVWVLGEHGDREISAGVITNLL